MSYPRVPIGDLVSLRQGFAINKNTKHHISDESTALPLLRIADMKDKVQNVFVKDTIPAHFIAKPEDIIYTRTGQVGLVFTDQYGVIHNNCFTVTPNDAKTLNRYYLYYVLQSEDFYSAANNLASGAAQPDLPHGAFRSIEIPVPPLASQMRIAEILKSYDDLIENNQKQIKLLEEAAQQLYKEWFVDLHFPGYETTPITDGIPEGWEQNTIDSIIDLQSGFAFKSADFCDSGTYKIVTIKNVQDGLFDGQNVSRIDAIPARMPAHCRLGDGDILLSLTGNVGRVCVVNGQNYLLNQRVAKIKSDYPTYAYCLFRSSDMFTAMGNLANGAAQQNLSPIKTGQIKILIPPVDLLMRFEVAVSVYMKQMLNLNKQIELLQQARDRLLPKLMSGEIEV